MTINLDNKPILASLCVNLSNITFNIEHATNLFNYTNSQLCSLLPELPLTKFPDLEDFSWRAIFRNGVRKSVNILSCEDFTSGIYYSDVSAYVRLKGRPLQNVLKDYTVSLSSWFHNLPPQLPLFLPCHPDPHIYFDFSFIFTFDRELE